MPGPAPGGAARARPRTAQWVSLARCPAPSGTVGPDPIFGENLTVDGLPDDQVCIGDRFRIGDAEFEVTQPRRHVARRRAQPGWQGSLSDLVDHPGGAHAAPAEPAWA